MTLKALNPHGRVQNEAGADRVRFLRRRTGAAPVPWKENAALDIEEIISHVARGEVTPRNSRHRRINDTLAVHLNGLQSREQEIQRESQPLQQALRALPQEQRDLVYQLLELSNEGQRLMTERRILRRAVPLIQEFDHVTGLLRRDRHRAFLHIEKLKLQLSGQGRPLENDFQPEEIADVGLRNSPGRKKDADGDAD